MDVISRSALNLIINQKRAANIMQVVMIFVGVFLLLISPGMIFIPIIIFIALNYWENTAVKVIAEMKKEKKMFGEVNIIRFDRSVEWELNLRTTYEKADKSAKNAALLSQEEWQKRYGGLISRIYVLGGKGLKSSMEENAREFDEQERKRKQERQRQEQQRLFQEQQRLFQEQMDRDMQRELQEQQREFQEQMDRDMQREFQEQMNRDILMQQQFNNMF